MLIGTVCQPVQELVCPGTMVSLGDVMLVSDIFGIHSSNFYLKAFELIGDVGLGLCYSNIKKGLVILGQFSSSGLS